MGRPAGESPPVGRRALALVVDTPTGVAAVQVDCVRGREQVLVHGIEGRLGARPDLRGAAVRGDGSVLLIVDASEVIRAHRTA